MVITGIEEQKKNKDRRSIFIDGEFAFGLSAEDVYLYRLKTGMDITPKYLAEIKQNAVFADAKNKAVRYLSYSAKTKKQMVDKLKTYDFSQEIIEQVLDFLEQHRFIDDVDYAQKFTDSKKRAGYGAYRIKSELFYKGIAGEIIEQVIVSDEAENTLDVILNLLEKKIKSETKDEFYETERQKIYSFLSRRGFGFDDAKAAIKLYWEERSP